jgi:hypothetical protein
MNTSSLVLVPMRITESGSLVAQVHAFGQSPQWITMPVIQTRLLGLNVSQTFATSGYDNLGTFGNEQGILIENVKLTQTLGNDGKPKPVVRKEGAKEVPVTDQNGNVKYWNTLVPA